MEDKDPFIFYIQYNGSWWSGDGRNQGISSHGIDLCLPIYADLNTSRIKYKVTFNLTNNKAN